MGAILKLERHVLRAACMFALAVVLSTPALAGDVEIVRYEATVNDDGVQVVELEGGEYYFRPNYIVLKANVPAKLIVRKASGIVPHDIVIDEPEAGMKFKIGFGTEGETIEFTPVEPGIYPFYCDKKFLFFKSHREKGMEGLIEVVD